MLWRTALMLTCLSSLALAQANAEFDAAFRRGLDLLTKGNYQDSIKAFERCIEISPDGPTAYYNICCAYSLMKQIDKANEYLEKAMARGFLDLDHIEADHDLDNIRNSEGFRALIAKYFRSEAFKAVDAPSFDLKALDGAAFSSKTLAGKPYFVHFWSEKSPYAERELKALAALTSDAELRGKYAIVAISRDGARAQRDLAKRLNLSFSLLVADESLQGVWAEVKAVPTTFLVDAQGKVIRKFVGYTERGALEQVLRETLALPKAQESTGEEIY